MVYLIHLHKTIKCIKTEILFFYCAAMAWYLILLNRHPDASQRKRVLTRWLLICRVHFSFLSAFDDVKVILKWQDSFKSFYFSLPTNIMQRIVFLLSVTACCYAASIKNEGNPNRPYKVSLFYLCMIRYISIYIGWDSAVSTKPLGGLGGEDLLSWQLMGTGVPAQGKIWRSEGREYDIDFYF